jgi:hypothetical protein
MESKSTQNYQSYLLRLWSGSNPSGKNWRAALVNPNTGEQLWFSSLEHLYDFLKDQTGARSGDDNFSEPNNENET